MSKESIEVLNHHAKSFSWGGFFLPRKTLKNAAYLYHFCRYCDDIADDSPDKAKARLKLESIQEDLRQNKSSDPIVQNFLRAASTTQMKVKFAIHLLDGLIWDQDPVQHLSLNQLVIYCYRVAGTVGGLMCGVLNVLQPVAIKFAIDLGIAMQLTNICRDVLEDAKMDRVYLPIELEPSKVPESSEMVTKKTREMLILADRYYRSAEQGFRYIPFLSRFGIMIAARLYEGIGVKLLRHHSADPLHGRTYLTKKEKVWIVLKTSVEFLWKCPLSWTTSPPLHKNELHTPIKAVL